MGMDMGMGMGMGIIKYTNTVPFATYMRLESPHSNYTNPRITGRSKYSFHMAFLVRVTEKEQWLEYRKMMLPWPSHKAFLFLGQRRIRE